MLRDAFLDPLVARTRTWLEQGASVEDLTQLTDDWHQLVGRLWTGRVENPEDAPFAPYTPLGVDTPDDIGNLALQISNLPPNLQRAVAVAVASPTVEPGGPVSASNAIGRVGEAWRTGQVDRIVVDVGGQVFSTDSADAGWISRTIQQAAAQSAPLGTVFLEARAGTYVARTPPSAVVASWNRVYGPFGQTDWRRNFLHALTAQPLVLFVDPDLTAGREIATGPLEAALADLIRPLGGAGLVSVQTDIGAAETAAGHHGTVIAVIAGPNTPTYRDKVGWDTLSVLLQPAEQISDGALLVLAAEALSDGQTIGADTGQVPTYGALDLDRLQPTLAEASRDLRYAFGLAAGLEEKTAPGAIQEIVLPKLYATEKAYAKVASLLEQAGLPQTLVQALPTYLSQVELPIGAVIVINEDEAAPVVIPAKDLTVVELTRSVTTFQKLIQEVLAKLGYPAGVRIDKIELQEDGALRIYV